MRLQQSRECYMNVASAAITWFIWRSYEVRWMTAQRAVSVYVWLHMSCGHMSCDEWMRNDVSVYVWLDLFTCAVSVYVWSDSCKGHMKVIWMNAQRSVSVYVWRDSFICACSTHRYLWLHMCLQRSREETLGAGVDILTVDTHFSLHIFIGSLPPPPTSPREGHMDDPHMNKYEWINFIHMRAICMNQGTHSRESCLTYEWV